MEILLFIVLGTLAVVFVIFWIAAIIAGLPAAAIAVVLWHIGLPLWLSILIGVVAFGGILTWLDDRKRARQEADPRGS